eukprot:1850181-Rhodomonas_salina.1
MRADRRASLVFRVAAGAPNIPDDDNRTRWPTVTSRLTRRHRLGHSISICTHREDLRGRRPLTEHSMQGRDGNFDQMAPVRGHQLTTRGQGGSYDVTVLTVVGYGTPTNKVISPTQSPVSCSPWVSQSEDLSDTLSTPASCCKELKANSYMK